MNRIYRIGERSRRSRRKIAVILLLIVLAAAGYYGYREFARSTQVSIKNSAGSTVAQNIPNSQTTHFDHELFGFDAPMDWKLVRHDTAPHNLYSYRSTLKNADNRFLDIYVDNIPLTLPVNKAVAVEARGANLSHGQVSENCTTFTNATARMPGGTGALSVTSRWEGVEFMCDLDSSTRNVVGTSSPGNVNKVTLTSLASGPHSVFFVYTDNNHTPEYNIFYKILDSFILK